MEDAEKNDSALRAVSEAMASSALVGEGVACQRRGSRGRHIPKTKARKKGRRKDGEKDGTTGMQVYF